MIGHEAQARMDSLGGGGQRKGRGQQKKRGRRGETPAVQFSKKMSTLLRHNLEKCGLEFNEGGFVSVAAMLKLPQFRGHSREDVTQAVANCPKQRFELSASGSLIRATQGHTVKAVSSEALLAPITDASLYPVCVHGTSTNAWQQIRRTGLNRMQRNHVHMAIGEPEDGGVISGMRKSSQVIVAVDMAACLARGIPFFVSTNNVLLSPGPIPPACFLSATRVPRPPQPRVPLQFDPIELPPPPVPAPAPSPAPVAPVTRPPPGFEGYAAPQTHALPSRVNPTPTPTPASAPPSQRPGFFDASWAADAPSKGRPEYIAVLDFEATCNDKRKILPQEIIEVPTVLIRVADRATVQFQRYVRPVAHPTLTPFCIQLTGIEQPSVDASDTFAQVLEEYTTWLEMMGMDTNKGENAAQGSFVFATCGQWDLAKALPAQLKHAGIQAAPCFKDWCNVKTVFKKTYGTNAGGMIGMLKELNIKHTGKHHSGIDDCRNIAKIVLRMMDDGAKIGNTGWGDKAHLYKRR